jgi:hypothetical protein
VRLEGLGKLKKIHIIGTRSRDLPACSIVPQRTALPRASYSIYVNFVNNWESFKVTVAENLMQTLCSILPSIAAKGKHEVEKALE